MYIFKHKYVFLNINMNSCIQTSDKALDCFILISEVPFIFSKYSNLNFAPRFFMFGNVYDDLVSTKGIVAVVKCQT